MSNVNAQGTSPSLVQGQRRDTATAEQRGSSLQSSHHGNPEVSFVDMSQAFDNGVDLPTAMFNTAAFGEVDLANAAATRESTEQTLPHLPDTKQPSSLNKPLEAYPRTDDSLDNDDFMQDMLGEDFDVNDFELDIETDEVALPAAPSGLMVSVQQNEIVDIQVLNENRILKQRIAEVQRNAASLASLLIRVLTGLLYFSIMNNVAK